MCVCPQRESDKAKALEVIESVLTFAVTNKIEAEYKLETYDDLDAFKDFNEMVIQFGYITLFAVALPIAPLLAVLNNFFEIRGDAFALSKGNRRRSYQTKRTIGSWLTVLEILSMTAVITNALLTGFVNSTVADMDPLVDVNAHVTQIDRMGVSRLWMWVFIFEHFMLLARMVLQNMAGSEAEWVHLQRQLVDRRIKQHVKKDKNGKFRKRRTSQTGTAIDAFLTNLKKTVKVEHKFSMEHSTIMLSHLPRTAATEASMKRLLGGQGTVLAASVRVREGALSWALVTFSESPPAIQAIQGGAAAMFQYPIEGEDHQSLLRITIEKVDMQRAILSDGAFGLLWKQQVEKVEAAYTRHQQGYSSGTLKLGLKRAATKSALLMSNGGMFSSKGKASQLGKPTSKSLGSANGGDLQSSLGLMSALNSYKAGSIKVAKVFIQGDFELQQTPQAKIKPAEAVGGDSEEVRPPMSAAVSPTDNPPTPVLPTPVQPPRMPVGLLAPPVTPARGESLEKVFARLDRSRDGQLDQAEVGQMLALLRAQATACTADEEWLQPSDKEIASAMREMDLDRSGRVAFYEFQSWWLRKNHDGEFAASPAMWGVMEASDDEPMVSSTSDDEDDDEPVAEPVAKSPVVPGVLLGGTTGSEPAAPPEPEEHAAHLTRSDAVAIGHFVHDEAKAAYHKAPDDVAIDITPEPPLASDDHAVEWSGTKQGDHWGGDQTHLEVVALFRKIDANGSGSLDRNEVRSLIIHLRAKAMGGDTDEDWLHPSEEELAAAMVFMDLDGNGTVSIDEFLEWWELNGGWDYAGDPAEWE